jgi:hypothetical protein
MSLLSPGKIGYNILELFHVFARIPFTRIIQASLSIHVDKMNTVAARYKACTVFARSDASRSR